MLLDFEFFRALPRAGGMEDQMAYQIAALNEARAAMSWREAKR